MTNPKRQASLLGSTLTSLTLNSDSTSESQEEEEASEEDDDDCEEPDARPTKLSEDSDTEYRSTENEAEPHKSHGNSKTFDIKKETKKIEKPKVRMKTLTIDGQLVYFCVLCDKIFTRKKDKLNHELAHSSETIYTCTECGKEYFHESSLAYHMSQSHDADQLYLCELCPKMFAQGHHLKTHILSHSKPTEFTCKICYQDFALASELSEHVRIKINEELKTYWCKLCKIYLCRNHIAINNPRRLHAHQCTACNELFFSQKKLRLHMKKFSHKSAFKSIVLEPLEDDEMFLRTGTEIASCKKLGNNLLNNSVTKIQGINSGPIGDSSKRHAEDNEQDIQPLRKRRRIASKSFQTDQAILSSSSLQDSGLDVKRLTDSFIKSPLKGRKV